MAQYEKFEEWMIGQCVIHVNDANDPGVVVGGASAGCGRASEAWATVRYEREGELVASVSNLIFQDETIMQEITINGQRYKLVKIVD